MIFSLGPDSLVTGDLCEIEHNTPSAWACKKNYMGVEWNVLSDNEAGIFNPGMGPSSDSMY